MKFAIERHRRRRHVDSIHLLSSAWSARFCVGVCFWSNFCCCSFFGKWGLQHYQKWMKYSAISKTQLYCLLYLCAKTVIFMSLASVLAYTSVKQSAVLLLHHKKKRKKEKEIKHTTNNCENTQWAHTKQWIVVVL